jgi:hypothetical protein
MHPHHLQAAHEQIKEESSNKFKTTRKMGSESMSTRYLEELSSEVDELYASYVKHNDSKNIFAFSRTATSLIAVMTLTYLMSGVLEWFWLGSFSFLLNFLFWSCFVLLFAWVYVKYSGEYKEIGEYIDGLADILWRKVSFLKIWDFFIDFFLNVNRFINLYMNVLFNMQSELCLVMQLYKMVRPHQVVQRVQQRLRLRNHNNNLHFLVFWLLFIFI